MKKLFTFFGVLTFLFSSQLYAQHSIKGKVSNEDGEVLIGAVVKIQNNLRGGITNQNGEFVLRNLSTGPIILSLSYLGYIDKLDTLDLQSSIEALNYVLKRDVFIADELIVTATRVERSSPISHTNIDKAKIEEMNVGRDVPYIINQSPSVVSTSDAGAGIGYSALRIRGIDQTNINVTINGIALNDAEGHGVYWVDLPDFSSSLSDIQIQRGVGTSTNGAGAFGSSINLQTEKASQDAHAEIHAGGGSFNTKRGTVKFGTGLLNDHWSIDGRLSRIESDGYVDRAHSFLTSYYLTGGYKDETTSVKIIAFGGHENTYQSWNGIDRETLKTDRTFNSAGAIYDDNWNVVGYYPNQVDNYDQDHFQLIVNQKIGENLRLNLAGHYTYGRGYYESYWQDVNVIDYGISPSFGDTISDLIDQQWLDNDYYGMTYNLNYTKGKASLDFGGAMNRYDGDHFGEVIWARSAGFSNKWDKYYFNNGLKDDFNVYLKYSQSLGKKLGLFADIQYRKIAYTVQGTDNYAGNVNFTDNLDFINPKLGFIYDINNKNQVYYSIAVANREPNRNDYINAPDFQANAEKLTDHELGYRYRFSSDFLQANIYYMDYSDQLVLTGEINNVGEPLRANSGKSYRAGLEISAQVFLFKNLTWMPNVTFSSNRNLEYKYFNDNGMLVEENTPLSYSPEIIANNAIQYQFLTNFIATFYSYYIGEQFLNNSGLEYARLDAYHFHDLRIEFRKPLKDIKSLGLYVNINNIFNAQYVSNGYLWGESQYVFPQAGLNFITGVNLKF